MNNGKILIHVCCGICGAYVIEKLKPEFRDLVLFFYNPNIHPEEEYLKRLEVAEKLSKIYDIFLIVGDYNPEKYFKAAQGYEKEPEGGARCPICFRLRLNEAAKTAKENGCDYFTTTLTMGPQKKAEIVNAVGREEAEKFGIKFWDDDFKKKDGFKKTMEIAKKHNFYRQNYCGCVYSKMEREAYDKNKNRRLSAV